MFVRQFLSLLSLVILIAIGTAVTEEQSLLKPEEIISPQTFIKEFDQIFRLSPLEKQMMETKPPYYYNDYAKFALLASGLVESQLLEPKKKIDQLIGQLTKELSLRQISENILPRSDHILQLLHTLILSQYTPNQSGIDGILNRHSFNCVSSAVFYAIVCRQLNINITGVITTDHVLAQLKLSANNKIDIETTVKFGFDPSSKTGILDQFGQLTGFAYVDPNNYRQRKEINDRQMLALIYYRYDELTKQSQFKEATALLYRAYLLAGDLPFTTNTWNNAINNYIVSLEKAKRSSDALYALSQLADIFPEIEKIPQLQYSIYINWTQALIEKKDYQQAIAAADDGLTYFANDILLKQNLKAALLNRFYRLSKTDDFETTFDLIQRMTNQFPAENDFQTLAVNLVANQAKHSPIPIAEELFLRAISKYPKNSKLKELFAYRYIKETQKLEVERKLAEGINLLNKAQQVEAIISFQSMIIPKLVSMLNNLSLQLLSDKKYSQAKAVIEQGLELSPDSKPLNNNWDVVMLQWGQLAYNQGHFKTVIQILVNGRQRSKKDRQTFNQLIEAYYNETAFRLLDAKKIESSIVRFEEGLKILPKSNTLKHNLEIARSELKIKK